MNVRAIFARVNRVQKSLPFKVAASGLIVLLAIGAFVTYLVITRPPEVAPGDTPATQPATEATAPLSLEALEMSQKDKSAIQSAERIFKQLAATRRSPTNAAFGITLAAGVALIVVWMGLALTYLSLLVVAGAIAFPMSRYPPTKDYATVLMGVTVLAAAFAALIAAVKGILSDNPVSEFFAAMARPMSSPLAGTKKERVIPLPIDSSVRGIATKTIIEALRMKVSLIFIVMLIFALAALPLLFDESTPLRYRVQSFLQWGTGGSYWIIATLTLMFGVASVAFEQRDRQIWQTMTKPVSAAQYILGKWIGLIGLNAVLLAVCSAGVFLFTEYLREQPAQGERGQEALIAQGMMSEDRMILETQVLQARIAVEPEVMVKKNDEAFLNQVVKPYIEDGQKRDPEFGRDAVTYQRVVDDLYKQTLGATRSIPPGDMKEFVFKGLKDAKNSDGLLTLRYRIDAGSNSPDQFYKITFIFQGVPAEPQSVGLGPNHTMSLYPNVIDDNGDVIMQVVNGALVPQRSGETLVQPNPETCQFPTGGLEISYAAGSFQMNFLRVVFVLWVKLAFLSMLAVTAATFLSFPVACLVAFSVFVCAEGSGFLATSLEYYDATDSGDHVVLWKTVIRAIGLAISGMFRSYADLKPTSRLIDGQLLPWGSVAWGTSVLAAWTLVLYVIALSIFRKRELATYSGQ